MLLLVPTIPESSLAGGQIAAKADRVELPGGWAETVAITIDPPRVQGTMTVERMMLGDLRIEDIVLTCARLRVTAETVGCAGDARFTTDASGTLTAPVTGAYDVSADRLDLTLAADPFGGRVSARISLAGEALNGAVDFHGLVLDEMIADRLTGMSVSSGLLRGSVQFAGAADRGGLEVDLDLSVDDLGFDNADGTVAAAALSVQVSGQVGVDEARQRFDLQVAPAGGEVLLGSLYLDFARARPVMALTGVLDGEAFQVERGRLSDADALDLSFSGEADLGELEDSLGQWQLDLERAVLPDAYDRYLANFAQSTGLGSFDTDGLVRGDVSLSGTTPEHVTIDLRDVSIADRAGRFAISRLAGLVDYDASGDSSDSELQWDSAQIYEVTLGGGRGRFTAAGESFALLDPLQVQVFDGGLTVRTLAFADYGAADMTLDFEADIQPISLRPVTEALGWPPLNGTISGEIPRVTLREQVVEVGGAIDLDVFAGTVRLEKLRLERLFGVLPTLAGDVILEDLDLQQMTGAFSFGEIRGRLEGGVRNLRLLNWQPVAFDMTLHTPESDPSKHRISQRAVENLTSIGGGPTAVLSETFLRFFDDFGYQRLGLACRLQNNVCRMSGVRPAPNGGYYIVEGSGIPRIDVIGYSREVDFPQLIRRVEAATAAGSPTFD